MFPWSRADFRHHVLRLVREYVPAIMEELHTIVDLSDPDEIRRDIDACATRWQREKPWITRTMHRTVRVWRQAPAMRASRQWGPCFLRMAGGTGVRGDAERTPVPRIQADAHEPDHRGRGVPRAGAARHAARRIRDHRGRPNSSGRRPYRRQSACACARSSPPQGPPWASSDTPDRTLGR